MKHYYHDFTFSPTQAAHANRVVTNLIRKRRFFLTRRIDIEQGNGLDPNVFDKAIELDMKIRQLYSSTRTKAVERIKSGERRLDVTPPDLGDNRQLVVCNQYGGGFDIYRVYPLSVFAAIVSDNADDILNDIFNSFIGKRNLDDITPRKLNKYRERTDKLFNKIWSEFEQIELFDPLNHRCVVILDSKLSCSGRTPNNDFAENRLKDLQDTPFAMGYLFWKLSQQTRIIKSGYAVFGTSRDSHVRVEQELFSEPECNPIINYDAEGGYTCNIKFVTIL